MSQCRAIAHLPDGSAPNVELADIDRVVGDKQSVLWLDIQDPTEADLELLRKEFGFHELALEDALRGGQRPKVDEYTDYYFVVLYGAELADEKIITHEIHCFWGPNYWVTLHDDRVAEIDTAIERWRTADQHREFGVAYEAYALFDAVVDSYFPVADAIADQLEDLEERIFNGDASLVREVFSLRKQLISFRRILAPLRDVLNELIRRDVEVFPETLVPYLADVYDHAIRVMDTLDLHRDLLSSAIETHLSVTSNRLNQTMRTLTALTIGLMVPTLIAGVYGMNFQNMPELSSPFGYPIALAAMVLSVVVLFIVFKQKDWL